jgi:NADH-quinone oxidoreductase subunit C
MSEITTAYIEQSLKEHFGENIKSIEDSYGMLSVITKRETIVEMVTWLRDHPILQFNFLTDICGIHFPDHKNEELGVVYHMHSFVNNIRIRLHIFFPESDPKAPSLIHIFAAAGWMERETFDFYGIRFQGHGDMRRILNMEDMNYHPLLKQYPLEDGTRTDKEDKYFGR